MWHHPRPKDGATGPGAAQCAPAVGAANPPRQIHHHPKSGVIFTFLRLQGEGIQQQVLLLGMQTLPISFLHSQAILVL